MLFQLKEYPPEASHAVILRYIERYHFLQDLGVSSLDLQGLSPAMLRYCADLAKRTDARAFRRFRLEPACSPPASLWKARTGSSIEGREHHFIHQEIGARKTCIQ